MAKGMLLLQPVLQFLDNTGLVLNGGLVYFYSPGTTTPKNTYTTAAKSVANANPVVLDSAGRPDSSGTPIDIYLDGSYKVVVKTSAGVTIRTIDPVNTLGQLVSTRATSSNDAIAEADRDLLLKVDATAGAKTITLLAAATAGDGFVTRIQKIDSSTNTVIIDGNASETINSALTYVLVGQWSAVTLICDGTGWFVQSDLSTLNFSPVTAAVNGFTMTGSATGNTVSLSASGSDTNIAALVSTKGTGILYSWSANTSTPFIWQSGTSLQHTTTWNVPNTAQSRTITLPDTNVTILDGSLTNASTSFTPGTTGFSGSPTVSGVYQKIGRLVTCVINISGTSNSTSFTITGLPFAAAAAAIGQYVVLGIDNGAGALSVGTISSTTMTMSKGAATGGGNWTSSGTKGVTGAVFTYESTT